ncbi:MAG: hypothetical protein PHN26_07395 [Eubacteriaceae bacterium]|nr:hypothetical protein [Eubacteriaceae bacterium]
MSITGKDSQEMTASLSQLKKKIIDGYSLDTQEITALCQAPITPLMSGARAIRKSYCSSPCCHCPSFCLQRVLSNYDGYSQARGAGVQRVSINLPVHHPQKSRELRAIHAALAANLSVCSGVILDDQTPVKQYLAIAQLLKPLRIQSIVIGITTLKTPTIRERLLRITAIFRFILPDAVILLSPDSPSLFHYDASPLTAGANGFYHCQPLVLNG